MSDLRSPSDDETSEGFYAALLDDDPAELYERAPCGYLSSTPDGTIVKVNKTFLAWTGYDRAAIVGKRTLSDLLSAGGRIYHETHYAPMLRMHGIAKEIALDIVCADGRRLPVLVNSILERDANDTPLVIRTAVFDARDRRQYERELLAAKQRAEESERRAIELARTLQRTLIPPAPPDIPGLELSAAYRPAGTGSEVGGDFFDIFELAPGDYIIAVGDVCGKGVDAAVITALARYTIRAAAVRHDQPSEVLSTLNDVLLRDATDRFCTVTVVRLHQARDGWTAHIACGGHPLPVHVTESRRPQLVGRPGTLIGAFERPELHDTTIDMRAGDVLVLYTDGVTEARRDNELFGDTRLLEAVGCHRSDIDISNVIVNLATSFQRGIPRDDMVVVATRVTGS